MTLLLCGISPFSVNAAFLYPPNLSENSVFLMFYRVLKLSIGLTGLPTTLVCTINPFYASLSLLYSFKLSKNSGFLMF